MKKRKDKKMVEFVVRFRKILDEINICHFLHQDGMGIEIHHNIAVPNKDGEIVIIYFVYNPGNDTVIAHAVLANKDLNMKLLNTVEDFCNTWHDNKTCPRLYVCKRQESLVCDWNWDTEELSDEFIKNYIILKFISVAQMVFTDAVKEGFYEKTEKESFSRAGLKGFFSRLEAGKKANEDSGTNPVQDELEDL